MEFYNKIRQSRWAANEELIYSVLCSGISVSLIFWPLLNSICCITLFCYWLIFTKKSFSPGSRRSKWLILFSLIYLVTLFGLIYSGDLPEGLAEAKKKSALILFPLVFGMSQVISPVVVKRSLDTFTWSTCIGCIWCIVHGLAIYFSEGRSDSLYGYKLVTLKDMLPFLLGLCCLVSLLYLVQGMLNNRRSGRTIGFANPAVAIFLFLFLFLLGNRNILMCLCIFFVICSFRLISTGVNRLLIIASLLALMIVAIVANPYLNEQWKDLVDFSTENNIQLDTGETLGRAWGGKTIRLSIWKCSIDLIKKHPLMGIGTGGVQAALQDAYEKRKFYFASRYNRYNAHNQYIQQTIAYGLVGLLIFLACIILPLFSGLKNEEFPIYPFFLFCFAILCVTESMLELNKGIVWYSFFNAIFMFRKN